MQRALYNRLRDALKWNMAVSQGTANYIGALTLFFRQQDDPWTYQISVRQSVTEVVFNQIGKVMFRTLFWTAMTNVVTQLHFQGQGVQELF